HYQSQRQEPIDAKSTKLVAISRIPKVIQLRSKMRVVKMILILAHAVLLVGCSAIAQRSSSGVIVARRAQIRSSTAVVAADLLQVNRGDQVDIMDSVDVTDPNDNTRKERWLRVRGHDEDTTE